MARILVAEDDIMVRRLIRVVLEAEGHGVQEASGGSQAVRLTRAAPPDLVLCDLFMADGDGVEVVRELGRACPGLPVVAMSGGSWNGLIDLLPAAARLGAPGVLYK